LLEPLIGRINYFERECELRRPCASKTYAVSGRKGVLEKDLQAALARWEKDHWHTDAFNVATLYVRLRDKDKAFAWIDKLIEVRSPWLIWIFPGDPLLRSDPRFADVKRKMGMQN